MDFHEAVAAQPERLARSAAVVRAGLAELELDRWRTGVLATVSIGASSHAAHALVARLARGGRRALALDAAELFDPSTGPPADSYLLVSEGGRSRETLEAAEAAADRPRLAVTNDPAAPLAGSAEAALALGHGPDSPVYTVGYTATLQAFGLLATALDGRDEGDAWDALPRIVEQVLTACRGPVADAGDRFAGVAAVDVVAPTAYRTSAAEGALLLRESTRIPAAAFETYQYLHGPMESVDARTGCVVVGDEREVELAQYLAGTGAPTVLITCRSVAPTPGLVVVPVPDLPVLSRSLVHALPLQVLVGELARHRGVTIGEFRYHQEDTKVGAADGDPGPGSP